MMRPTPGPGLVMVTLAAVASSLPPITRGAAAGVRRSGVECSPDLLELVGSEVMECVRRQQEVGRGAGQQFPQAGVWAQEAVCVMVARMVTKCGAMWRNCYSDTEVKEMQRLQLRDLRAQYRHQLQDLAQCADYDQLAEVDMDTVDTANTVILDLDNDTVTVNLTVSDDYYYDEDDDDDVEENDVDDNEDVYEYSSIETAADGDGSGHGGGGSAHHCDERSCLVRVEKDPANTETPGFFGSFTKLLQPLFTLDL